jgi:hypothetical protein
VPPTAGRPTVHELGGSNEIIRSADPGRAEAHRPGGAAMPGRADVAVEVGRS